MSEQAVESTHNARLLDGRLVSLRPLSAGDADAVSALHQHLSDHDRYFRFFTLRPVGLPALVAKLTRPADGVCALGAFDAGRLIGVAHYTVVHEEPRVAAEVAAKVAAKVAEVAVLVAPEDHSLGVGTALLKQLGRIARANGVGRFTADVLGENHLMLTVFLELGWHCEPPDGSIRHLEIDLPEDI